MPTANQLVKYGRKANKKKSKTTSLKRWFNAKIENLEKAHHLLKEELF